jgi:hypothetical protein
MSHALVRPGWGTRRSRARWSDPFPAETPVPPDAFINLEPSDQKVSRWSSLSRARMVQAGIDEADGPRWRLRPEPGYRAISGIVGRDHTGGTVVIAGASYSPFVIAEVRLSTGTASLVRVLPKRESMNSPLHWQGGPPPWCGPPTPSRIW